MALMTSRVVTRIAAILTIITAVACRTTDRNVAGCDTAPWTALIASHLQRYPHMQEADVFKLLHHATMGSEHAIADTAAVSAWMDREWSTMDDGPTEPLVDTLGNNGAYARVHLRAYRAAGGEKETLTRAFVETGRIAKGDTAQLSCALDAVVHMAQQHTVPWSFDTLQSRRNAWATRGYPAVSHSSGFRERYRPAYRVVALRLL